MSSISLNGDTSGSILIQAPAIAGSGTLTLPTITGTIGTLNSGTAQASTSGTSIDFTGIPAGVRRITVMWNGVSTNGSSNYLLQIGAGSVTTSGYTSVGCFGGTGSGGSIFTQGFGLPAANANNVCYGHFVLTLQGSNTWVCSYSIGVNLSGSAYFFTGGGSIALSGTLDRLRNTTANGTDTFDAGSINILYE